MRFFYLITLLCLHLAHLPGGPVLFPMSTNRINRDEPESMEGREEVVIKKKHLCTFISVGVGSGLFWLTGMAWHTTLVSSPG